LKINRAILYLIGFLVPVACYGIFHHLVFFNQSAFQLALFNVQTIPLYYLAPPMIFFYVRSTLKDNTTLSKSDLLHFLPAFIGLVSILPYIFKSFDYKISIAQQFIDNPNTIKMVHTHWFYPNYVNVIARPTQLFFYSIACLVLIWNYTSEKATQSPVLQKKIVIKWLICISVISFLISLSYMLMTYKFFITTDLKKEVFNQLPISLFGGFAYTIIPVLIIIFPDILYGIPRATTPIEINNENKIEKNTSLEKTTDDPFHETAKQILNYMEQGKPYLNTKFSIVDLIEDLNLPKHHVYYCFNNILPHKFTTLRTHYRIAHAKKLLLSEKVDVMSMEGIGLESGFASKSSFFSVFKQETGLTPFDFAEKNRA
jgi:AraC-like DNA-binding protein